MNKKYYKGFDKDLKCRGFQYEIGKEYEEEKADLCESGFHACEFPLDVFEFYAPANNRFCVVDLDGEKKNDNKKTCATKIKIGAEIGLFGIAKAAVEYVKERVNWEGGVATNTGYYSAATNTGYYSAATNTGYYSAATNTGYYSAATNTGDKSAATNTGDKSAASVEGKESIAMAIGYQAKAKGAVGCWLVLAEWGEIDIDGVGHIVDVKCAKVDGEKIKADTWYVLRGGKFLETV